MAFKLLQDVIDYAVAQATEDSNLNEEAKQELAIFQNAVTLNQWGELDPISSAGGYYTYSGTVDFLLENFFNVSADSLSDAEKRQVFNAVEPTFDCRIDVAKLQDQIKSLLISKNA